MHHHGVHANLIHTFLNRTCDIYTYKHNTPSPPADLTRNKCQSLTINPSALAKMPEPARGVQRRIQLTAAQTILGLDGRAQYLSTTLKRRLSATQRNIEKNPTECMGYLSSSRPEQSRHAQSSPASHHLPLRVRPLFSGWKIAVCPYNPNQAPRNAFNR